MVHSVRLGVSLPIIFHWVCTRLDNSMASGYPGHSQTWSNSSFCCQGEAPSGIYRFPATYMDGESITMSYKWQRSFWWPPNTRMMCCIFHRGCLICFHVVWGIPYMLTLSCMPYWNDTEQICRCPADASIHHRPDVLISALTRKWCSFPSLSLPFLLLWKSWCILIN